MSEPIKQPQHSNNNPTPAPQAQSPQPKATWPKNTVRNFLYVISLMGLVSLLFWLVIPTNPPATLAQVTPATTATGGWESPIYTVIPTQTSEITPTRTPAVIGVVATIYPTPTQAPPPTATPTFEPLSDKPIMGYVFGPPEQISQDNYMEIVGWLPNSNEELLVRTFADDHYVIEKLNIKTAIRQPLVKTKLNIIGNPVWLSATQQTAYIGQTETGEYNLYYGNGEGQDTLILPNVSPPLVPAPSQVGVLVFDKAMSQLLDTTQGVEQLKPLTLPEALPIVNWGPFGNYQVAWSDKTDWVAYFNPEKFILINLKTQEVKNIKLEFWVRFAIWSPDGKTLALEVADGTQDDFIPQLATFDEVTGNIQFIKDSFRYITNLTWSPDSHQILITAVIGQNENRYIDALFLIDISTNQIMPVPITTAGFYGYTGFSSLTWSSDGSQILIGYDTGWHKIPVKIGQ